MTLAPARQKAVDLIRATCADEAAHGLDTYRAVRPQQIPDSWKPGDRLVLDCSDYCRMICRASGIPDPAGYDYDPYGNSSSIFFHCPHIALADAQPGDIGVFGFVNGEHHATILHSKDEAGNWLVGNFGRQGEPSLHPLAYEIRDHPGMTLTICRVAVADPPPSHEDELRAMTGFYAWAAWRLGEGRTTWKPYGPRNPRVRPNVPRVIPPSWWKHLAVFLLNRKKGNP